jgi:hypothetical protein
MASALNTSQLKATIMMMVSKQYCKACNLLSYYLYALYNYTN